MSRSQKRKANAVKRSKEKIRKLEEQLQVSATRIQELSGNNSIQAGDSNPTNSSTNAGSSFGGRNSRNASDRG